MSVTFCAHRKVGEKWQEITPAGWEPKFEDDPDYGRMQTTFNPLSLQVSNGNFCRLMNLLGFQDFEYSGRFSGPELQKLIEQVDWVLESLQAMPELDGGTPTTREDNIIDCGLGEGYYHDRLQLIHLIATAAIDNNGVVTYA